MLAQSGVFEPVRAFFEGVTATETRLVVSLSVILFTLAVGRFVIPPTVRYLDEVINESLLDSNVGKRVSPIGLHVPTTLAGVILRTSQVIIVTWAVFTVLLVWGQTDVINEVVQAVTASIPLISKVVSTVLLVLIAYVGVNLLKDTIRDLSSQADWMTEHQEEILLRVSQLGLFLGMGMVFLFVWGVELGNILVGAGFLGIIVGLAARQTLGSMLAGFLLMFSRPFTIGDWVEIGEKEGMVTEITIFNTRIETFDGEVVVLPNDKVSEKPIVNRSENGLLRVRVDVGVDYDTDPDRAAEIAMEEIQEIRAVANVPTPDVYPTAFGDSAIILEMRFWIDLPTPPRKMKATAAVIGAVKERYEEEGIDIPFPQRHLSGGRTGGFRVHDHPGGERTLEGSPEEVEQSPKHD